MIKKSFYVLTMSVFALGMTVVPALAGNDIVSNGSEIMVGTMANSSSNSGANIADGSYGGDGGDGGDIRNRGDVDESSTGRGGNGGDSGEGGVVVSGNATAVTDAYNEVGTNRTLIDRCACEGDDDGKVKVTNRSRIMFMDYSGSESNTGANAAMGSEAGDAGNGGDIGSYIRHHGMDKKGGDGDHGSDVDESMTGAGGAGGSSSAGGLIQSGDSSSRTTSVNLLGRNITRIAR